MVIGDTFLIRSPINGTTHLYIIVAQSQEKSLLFNVTSFNPNKDATCLLRAKEHPFIFKESVINYEDGILAETENISQALNRNIISRNEKATKALVAKIVQGARKTDAISLKHLNFINSFGELE